jgi:hypothetical protein
MSNRTALEERNLIVAIIKRLAAEHDKIGDQEYDQGRQGTSSANWAISGAFEYLAKVIEAGVHAR